MTGCHEDTPACPPLPALDGIVARFGRDGFAVVPGFASAEEVDALAAGFDRLVAAARAGAGDPRRMVADADPFRLHRVVWTEGLDPAFDGWGADPRFTTLAARLLAPPRGPLPRGLVQLIQQAHFKLPGDGVAFPPHQDASNRRFGTRLWTDVNGRGSFLQMALAIDPMDADNGGLTLWAGSHRAGFIADPDTGAIPADRCDPAAAVVPRLAPGDLVVFGPFLVHGSGPNPSDRPRRLFIQGYTLPGANRRLYPGCGTGAPRAVPSG